MSYVVDGSARAMIAAERSGQWGEEWDSVYDVVVVGGGAAGASAALTIAAAGDSVVLLEKAGQVGGTTGKSGGMMWIPNNPILRAQNIIDDKDACLRYMVRTAYPALYNSDDKTLGIPDDRYRLIEAFYDRGGEAVDHHLAVGGVRLQAVDYPSYFAHLPEESCSVGRSIEPVFPADYRPGTDRSGGQMLVEGLLDRAIELGGTVRARHTVDDLIRQGDNGAVIGVAAADHANNTTKLFGARKGVIFGSGGFLHNKRMTIDYLRGPIFGGSAVEEATGDFVRIGIKAGAQLGNMQNAWWAQTVVALAAQRRATSYDVYSAFGDSMIMVNRCGRRVVDEKAPYNERSQVHFHWDYDRGEYPNLLLFMIFDDAVLKSRHRDMFRWPVPVHVERAKDFLLSGNTWDDLTVAITKQLIELSPHTGGVELDPNFTSNLRSTVDRFNTMALRGEDEDFQRGSKAIELRWAGPLRKGGGPSPLMQPLATTGPYHCVILGGAALDTKGGPITDRHGRVLNVDGEVIAGLYGAGNCVASPAGQTYWGPGGTVGPAFVQGYIAAKDVLTATARLPQ